MDEHVFNAGGTPTSGSSVNSTSYELSLVSIGEGLAGPLDLSSASYSTSLGFPSAYPAPGEVDRLTFTDEQTLAWIAEHAAGRYNLYRNTIASLPGLVYGDCEQQAIASNTTSDTDTPASGSAFFYLVTVENRLHEEGIKGYDGAGTTRMGGFCP